MKISCNQKIKDMDILNEIISSYRNGKTLESLENQFHWSLESIRKFLIKNGIEIRNSGLRKHFFDFNFFKKIDSHEKAQILGIIASDGNLSKKDYCLSLALIEDDIEYLNIIKDKIGYKEKLSIRENTSLSDKRLAILRLHSREMNEDLYKLGIVPAKSLILQFPTFEQVPEEFINSFILGYFEGDGSIWLGNRDKNYHICFCGTFEFCNQLQQLIKNKIGLNFSLRKYYKKESNSYLLEIGGNYKVIKFLNWLYKDSTFQMKRKYDKYVSLKIKYELHFKHGVFSHVFKKKNNKLTPENIFTIRERFLSGFTNVEIAKEFDISTDHVSHIRTGKAWGKLTRETLPLYQ